MQQGVLADVFDGGVWKDFMDLDGIPFLSFPCNFALTPNVDWFQPYKGSVYLTVNIYIGVLNLLRTERFINENVHLLGIIPVPKEPELTINTFLSPLVDELLKLLDGVLMEAHSN